MTRNRIGTCIVLISGLAFFVTLLTVVSCVDKKNGGTILNPADTAGTDTSSTDTSTVDTTVPYTVTEKLRIGFPDALLFRTERDTVMITVLNDSSGVLEWDVRGSVSWLDFSPTHGSGEEYLYFWIDRSALQPGIYRDSIRIASNGGDTIITVEVIIPADTSTHSIAEYWPFAVGNKWVWLDRTTPYWWALEIVDSIVIDSFILWHVRGEDAPGGTGEWWFTVANGNLMILADSSYGHGLHGQVGTIVCHTVECWNGSSMFSLFEADMAPGPGFDPYWRASIHYVPGSLNDLLGLYPIWAVGRLADTAFVCGNVPNCLGLQDKTTGDSLYTIFAPGWGPVLWDSWTMIYAHIGDSTYGSLPATVQYYHLSANDDTTSEMLYWFRCDDWTNIYVMGYRDSGMTVPNHILWEDQTGEMAGAVVFRADFIPVMWITDSMTMSVRNIIPDTTAGADSSWDPKSAFHFSDRDTGALADIVADIYPYTPYAVIESLQSLYDTVWYNELWNAMEDAGIQTWDDLVAAAWISGEKQIWWQSLALFVGMGAAITAYELQVPDTGQGLAKRNSLGIRIAGPAQDMAKKIGEYLKDEAMCKWCPKPGVPTIEMLQCQGVKGVLWYGQVCHDSYMYGKTAVECVNLCKVTMKCFTNICMPRNVAVADFDKVLFENNLEITPKEARDMVKQNIDALKPFF